MSRPSPVICSVAWYPCLCRLGGTRMRSVPTQQITPPLRALNSYPAFGCMMAHGVTPSIAEALATMLGSIQNAVCGDASLARYERLPLSSVGRAVTKKQRFLSKPTWIMLAALSDCGRLRQDGNIRRKEIRVQMETCSSECVEEVEKKKK
ncbi:hypothetical protein B296_00043308 [Ensete ventricosum]|uniref:Uncharacterized protein n=1 Tax=Ensete ventricosum TaxID=4639 RepID=A0A426Y4R3_ENSVE|nr:hypothetical protein B296_00043308 [Ensete ventricosum]